MSRQPHGILPEAPPTRNAFIATPLPIERELKRLFRRLDARIVFDIGSCEGEDAIRYAALFPSAVVYAVEPVPSNLRLIEENLARHPESHVKVLPCALSDSAGQATLFVSSGQPDDVTPSDWDYGNKSSSLRPPDRHLEVHPWVRFDDQIVVATTTLERVCRDEGISVIDFVHLDVQGAELEVLRGAGPYLEQIGAIWMEVEAIPLYQAQPLKPDVERFMAGHGFRKMVDTVGSISGDQLYFNPRLVRPRPDRLGAAGRWLVSARATGRRAARRLLRRGPRAPGVAA
jgi:FkbM family methyltransferase